MGIEFELKYRATPALLSQLRQELPGEEAAYHMQTTYYDTPAEDFSSRKCTLRCRRENDTHICTLKTPANGLSRQEWEVECEQIQEALDKLCKLGAPEDILALGEKGLVPICGARFTRIAKTVELGDCTLELALDQGVLTAGDREIPLCEAEVELKKGEQAPCVAYAKALQTQYGLVPEEKSKFRRALALYRGEKYGL